jgi:hypothetical protein
VDLDKRSHWAGCPGALALPDARIGWHLENKALMRRIGIQDFT